MEKTAVEKEKNQLKTIIKAQNHDFKNYLRYLSSPKRIFWCNMLAGTAQGLGFMVGTVVVLGVATFVIGKILAEIPWIGDFFQWMDLWLETNLKSYEAFLIK